jgi:hypothetical protein
MATDIRATDHNSSFFLFLFFLKNNRKKRSICKNGAAEKLGVYCLLASELGECLVAAKSIQN